MWCILWHLPPLWFVLWVFLLILMKFNDVASANNTYIFYLNVVTLIWGKLFITWMCMYNYIHSLLTFSIFILFFIIFWRNEKIHFKRNIYFQPFPTETLAGPASSTLQKPRDAPRATWCSIQQGVAESTFTFNPFLNFPFDSSNDKFFRINLALMKNTVFKLPQVINSGP